MTSWVPLLGAAIVPVHVVGEDGDDRDLWRTPAVLTAVPSPAGNATRLDEGVQGRALQPHVPAELDVAHSSLGDQATDEAAAGSQVLAGLLDRQQLVAGSAPDISRRRAGASHR